MARAFFKKETKNQKYMKRKIIAALLILASFTASALPPNPYDSPSSGCWDTWTSAWTMIGNGCLKRTCYCQTEEGTIVSQDQIVCIGPE